MGRRAGAMTQGAFAVAFRRSGSKSRGTNLNICFASFMFVLIPFFLLEKPKSTQCQPTRPLSARNLGPPYVQPSARIFGRGEHVAAEDCRRTRGAFRLRPSWGGHDSEAALGPRPAASSLTNGGGGGGRLITSKRVRMKRLRTFALRP